MADIYDYLAKVVIAIREDATLKDSFNRLLKIEGSTQKVQTHALLLELEKLGAPDEVKKFVKLLADPTVAHQVLKSINS